MAYCYNDLSSNQYTTALIGDIIVKYHINNVDGQIISGSRYGLGCSGFTGTVVCSVSGSDYGLVGFDSSNGTILWSSNNINPLTSYLSLPIIFGGTTLATDGINIKLFDTITGKEYYTIRGGSKFNPTITENGFAIVGMLNGGILAITTGAGQTYASTIFRDKVNGQEGSYKVISTPAIFKDRVFILTRFQFENGTWDPSNHACVYAVDVKTSVDQRLVIAWSYSYTALTSINSDFDVMQTLEGPPILLYYPDLNYHQLWFVGFELGKNPNKPSINVLALEDSGELYWSTNIPLVNPLPKNTNFTFVKVDNGAWISFQGHSYLYCINMLGKLINTLNINNALGGTSTNPFVLTSTVQIIVDDINGPLMILSATQFLKDSDCISYVVCLNQTDPNPATQVVWKFLIGKSVNNIPRGQFVVDDGVLIFSTFNDGIYGLTTNNVKKINHNQKY